MKEIYQKSKQELFQELQSTEKGLLKSQIKERHESYGLNELTGEKKKSVFLVFLEQFTDFLVIILVVAAIISAFLGDVESAVVIIAVITMNAILGTVQHIKAEQSLDSLKQMAMPTAKVTRDGETIVVASKDVTVGDLVQLEAGDYVCADGRIVENASLKINESALTGESLSVEKEDRLISEQVQIADRENMVFSGSFVTYGRGSFLVTGIGMNTEVGKIATLLKETKNKRTPLQISLDNFGKKLAIAVIVICAVLFGLSIYRGESVMHAFMFALALAVAAIPEALSSIVTIVLAFSTQKMVKEHAIVRKLQAVEGLGSVSIICSDKTGTLTQNKMTVKQYYTSHNQVPSNEFDVDDKLGRKLLYASSICNDSTNKDGVEIGDPTEIALIDFANKYNVSWEDVREEYGRIGEIPFDSERKLMSIAYQTEKYKNMVTKGAVDVLVHRITKIETDEGIRDITEEDKVLIEQANERFSESGLRVLAFATKQVKETKLKLDDEYDLTFLGLIAMMDPPREESKEAVRKCISAGIRPIMITGDHKVTATAIAKEIGIMQEGMLTVDGVELEKLTDLELQDKVEKVSVYARVSPEHKIRIVRAWQAKGNIVSMTGDGVNDAPALKQADVGVAMGITGTEVSKDAASMILTDDNFATIVKAIETGRNVYNNIKKSIKFLLSGNMGAVLAVVYAGIVGLSAPFEPVHLLFINLLTDSLPAIALGLDAHTSAVMKEKPRPINEGIMTKDFMLGILIEGTIIGFNTMLAYYIGLRTNVETATTMAFATLCLSRLVHGYNSKSDKPVLFTRKMWDNKYLQVAFLVGFVLLNAVILIPAMAPLFRVTALSLNMLLVIYGCSIANLFEIQLLKYIKSKIAK